MPVETIDRLPLFYQKLFLEIRSWLFGVALTEYCGKSTKREDEEPASTRAAKLAIYAHALMCNRFKYLCFFRFFEGPKLKWYGQNRTGRTARSVINIHYQYICFLYSAWVIISSCRDTTPIICITDIFIYVSNLFNSY